MFFKKLSREILLSPIFALMINIFIIIIPQAFIKTFEAGFFIKILVMSFVVLILTVLHFIIVVKVVNKEQEKEEYLFRIGIDISGIFGLNYFFAAIVDDYIMSFINLASAIASFELILLQYYQRYSENPKMKRIQSKFNTLLIILTILVLLPILAIFILICMSINYSRISTDHLMVGLTALYTIVTFLTLLKMKGNHDAEYRPYVVVDFEYKDITDLYLKVSNIGKLPATNVQFNITPTLTDINDEPFELKKLEFLPPSKSYSYFIDIAYNLKDKKKPTEYRVEITYQHKKKIFKEIYNINIKEGISKLYVRKDNYLEEINKTLQEISKKIDK